MPSSSQRDYKQHSTSGRQNRRRSSSTLTQNPKFSTLNFSGLNSAINNLSGKSKIALSLGTSFLVAALLLPAIFTDKASSEERATTQLETSQLSTPKINTAKLGIAQLDVATEKETYPDSIEIQENENLVSINLPLPDRTKASASQGIEESLSSRTNRSESFDPLVSQVTLTVKSGDTLGQIFTQNNLSYQDMLSILNNKESKDILTSIKPGDELLVVRKQIFADSKDEKQDEDATDELNYHVQSLLYEISLEEELHVKRNDAQGFDSAVIQTPLERRVSHAHGKIEDSLFLAGQAAGLNDNTIMNMAGIFQWDVDFILDIRKGDHFTVIYEQLYKEGEFVGNGNILAAEFHNDGKDHHAIRFTNEKGDSNYYAPTGKSMKKAFLRAPIAINPRVTSSFNPRRLHPVHKYVRPHRGVDYGGPLNTPILAAGDGKVIFRGRKGGYGNTVIIQHGGNITTLYAHLNKFNHKAKNGSRVKQGQVIGYLGATGTVTAKHLHYEYRVNGVHRNPRTVKLPNAKALDKKYQKDFEQIKENYLAQLATIKRSYLNANNLTSPETLNTSTGSTSSGSSAGQ